MFIANINTKKKWKRSQVVPRSHGGPKCLERNLEIELTLGKNESTLIIVDNATDWTTALFDPATNEEIRYFFCLVTPKGNANDRDPDMYLGRMCAAMNQAGVFHHTYDAKSGGDVRITRIGATHSRLEAYAHATKYRIGFDAEEVQQAYEARGLSLEDPGRRGTNSTRRGPRLTGTFSSKSPVEADQSPYRYLSAPFDVTKAHLYRPWTNHDRLTLMERILLGNTMLNDAAKGCGFDLMSLNTDTDENRQCLALFPLHDFAQLKDLHRKWLPGWLFEKLPLFRIKNYFGEEVAFYFSFLSHLAWHTLMLAPIAMAAQTTSIYYSYHSSAAALANMYPEAFCSVIFPSVFAAVLLRWRCKESHLALRWECLGAERELQPRPAFQGTVMKNPITGRLELDFPEPERLKRVRVTSLLSVVLVFLLLGTVGAIAAFRIVLAKRTGGGASQLTTLLPAILNSFQINLVGAIYDYIARWMTEYENHKLETKHDSALFRRLTFFYFINYFSHFLYTAFLKMYIEGCNHSFLDSTHCGRELGLQVTVVFLINDFGQRMVNSVITPWLDRKYLKYLIKIDKHMIANMGPIEKQFRLLKSFETTHMQMEYIELYIQWGYLVLFGAACPIIILIGSITNFIEMRTDGYKLLNKFRRVVPNRQNGVGEPFHLLMAVTYIGVFVNSGMAVYTFTLFSTHQLLPSGESRPRIRVWAFTVLVFTQLLVVELLKKRYPAISRATQTQLERQRVVYDRLVLGNEEYIQQLAFSEEHIGKTHAEVKAAAEGPEARDVHVSVRVSPQRKVLSRKKAQHRLHGRVASFSGQEHAPNPHSSLVSRAPIVPLNREGSASLSEAPFQKDWPQRPTLPPINAPRFSPRRPSPILAHDKSPAPEPRSKTPRPDPPEINSMGPSPARISPTSGLAYPGFRYSGAQ